MSGDKLAACPFCGKAARRSMVTVEEPFLYLVGCSDCPVAMDWQRTEDEATTARKPHTHTTTELVEALRGVVSHFPGEQGTGHSHSVPGVWDEDNHPALAGTKYEWCAHWEKVKALTLHDRALEK